MSLGLNFVPVLDLVSVFVDIYPIQLRGAVGDGGDETFPLPAPILVGVAEEVACEEVAGWFLEFQRLVFGDVDVKLSVGSKPLILRTVSEAI